MTDDPRDAVDSDEVPRFEDERRYGLGNPAARQHTEPYLLPRLRHHIDRQRPVQDVNRARHAITSVHHVEIPSGAMRQGA